MLHRGIYQGQRMRLTPSGATGTYRSAMTPLSFVYSADVVQHVETQRLTYTVGSAKTAHITDITIVIYNTNTGGGGTNDYGARVSVQKVGGAELTIAQHYMYSNTLDGSGGMMQVRDLWLDVGDILRAYTYDLRTTSAAGYNVMVALDELDI